MPEPALIIASVIRVARAAPSTESPAFTAPAALELLLELLVEELLEAAGSAVSELPQALRPSAAASATAAIEVVFMQVPQKDVVRCEFALTTPP
ncbi:hypothetical protein GCM10009867_13940 [Pedococcus aerophilus]|uniref:Secreted protein n=1 Tax=Pedococcus aerophilus TaxID=436356 RepID=A0ABP6GZJ3_9MICO